MSETKTIRVEVTQEDIEQGQRADCQACPHALAIRRALGRTDIYVGGIDVWSEGDPEGTLAVLPREVLDWIIDFDNFAVVDPITYDLEVTL